VKPTQENKTRPSNITYASKKRLYTFLAVLGILREFADCPALSTERFARDSQGDVYFFIKRQAIWLGIAAGQV